MTPLLKVIGVTKKFKGSFPLEILKGISFELFPGETLAIMGRSGEGKSTLLHLLGALDTPSEGTLFLNGLKVDSKSAEMIRSTQVGFVFQSYYLLEDHSVLENVLMPLRITRKKLSSSEMHQYGLNLLAEVGLAKKEKELAKHLSGGEKQRLAIARALCNHPPLLLADEPTGNLDSENAKMIQDLLFAKVAQFKISLILVTHDLTFALRCHRVLLLQEGLLSPLTQEELIGPR